MTAPALFRRNSADVQAMRLGSLDSLDVAQSWLWDHGITSVSAGLGRFRTLTIYGPGSRMVARLGDWLTLDERTATFAVVPDSEFQKEHREREAS